VKRHRDRDARTLAESARSLMLHAHQWMEEAELEVDHARRSVQVRIARALLDAARELLDQAAMANLTVRRSAVWQ
jgi:hypothetical protein